MDNWKLCVRNLTWEQNDYDYDKKKFKCDGGTFTGLRKIFIKTFFHTCRVAKKVSHKLLSISLPSRPYWPIVKIFSLAHSVENL